MRTLTGLVLLWPGAAFAICGDGVLEAGEACDDLDVDPGDGCDASCEIEPGWDCSTANFELTSHEEFVDEDPSHLVADWVVAASQVTATETENNQTSVFVT